MSRPTTNPPSHKPSPTPSINDHMQRQLNTSMYQSHDQMFIQQSGRKPSLLPGNAESRFASQSQGAAAAAIASALASQNHSQMYNSTDAAKAAAIAATNSYLSQYRGNARRSAPPQEPASALNFNPSAIAAVISSLSSMGINPSHPHYAQIIQQQLQQYLPKGDSGKKEQASTPQPAAPAIGHLSSGPPQMLCKNSGPTHASCYVPQVEAISPTPEDQKENSNLQEFKEKLMHEIERVDKDIASTQYQFDLLKKKQLEIEHEKFNQNEPDDLAIKNLSLAEKIYIDNKKKAEESHRQILKPLNSNSANETENSSPDKDETFDECIPFYHEYSDTKISQEIREHFDTVMKKRLMKYFKRQQLLNRQREKYLIEKYDGMHVEWQNSLDNLECVQKKRQKESKSREFYEKIFPELRKQREERERSVQKNQRIQSELADMALAEAHQLTEEERKRMLALSVVPPVIYDERRRKYSFVNENGFVADPVALFKQCKNEVFWNEKEKEIFLEKMLIYGKNFDAIASFLDKKTVGDCIEYYYLTKKKVNYKLLIRKNQRRRKKDIKSNMNNNNNNGGNSSSSTTNATNPPMQTNSSFNSNSNSGSSNSNTTNSNNQSDPNQLTVNTIGSDSTMDQVGLVIDTQNKEKSPELNQGNQTMTNDQSSNGPSAEERSKSEMSEQSRQNGDGLAEPLPIDTGDNENGDEANEDDEDDDDDDKSNSTKNSKHFAPSDNSCISCKKLKNAKKKPRSTKSSRRIGLRSVPKKYFSLSSSRQATVRLDFNLDIPETREPSEAPRIRLCLECFKRLLARLNELLAEELRSRQQEAKPAENASALTDDEYHDYDDDDEPVSESSEDPQENRVTSTTSPSKTKIETVSPTEQVTASQSSFDSSFQAIENSREKAKIMKSGDHDHSGKEDAAESKAPAKQISEVINDAIKTALQVSVTDKPRSPLESPVSSTSSQNSSFFGSAAKPASGVPETRPRDLDTKELMLHKQNDAPEVANGYSVLNDLISRQLHTNLSKMTTGLSPAPQTQQTQPAESDADKKYTLGRWVDTIIVKMNDKPVDEIDVQKFKDQLPMSSSENSAAANMLRAKAKSQSDESSCSSVASSPQAKAKQEILIESDAEDSLNDNHNQNTTNKMDQQSQQQQQSDERREPVGKVKSRIESIIENELASMGEEQTARGRTTSLTMKLLQENLQSPRPTPSPSTTPQAPRPSPSPKRQSPTDNWIGSMLGGVIIKSLNEELPPPVNIPEPNVKQRSVSPAAKPAPPPPQPKPTKDLNLIVQARSYGHPAPNPPGQTIASPSAKKGFTPVPQKIPPAQPVPHRPQPYMNYPMQSGRPASSSMSPSSIGQNSVAMLIQKELHDLDQQQAYRSRQYAPRQPNQHIMSPSPPPPPQHQHQLQSQQQQQQQQQQHSNQSYNQTSSPSGAQGSGLTAGQIASIIQAATSAASNSSNSAAAAAAAAAAAVACMNPGMFQSGAGSGAESLIHSIMSAANIMSQFNQQQGCEPQSGKKAAHSSTPLHMMAESHSHGYAAPSHHMAVHLGQHEHQVRAGLKSPQMHPGQMMHHSSPEIIIQESAPNQRHHMQQQQQHQHSPSKAAGAYGQAAPVLMPPYSHQMAQQMHHHEQQQSYKKRLLSSSMDQASMAKSQQYGRPSITGSHMIAASSMPPPSGGPFHQHGGYAPPPPPPQSHQPSSHHSQHLPPNYPKMLKSNQHSTIGPISYHNQYEYMSDTEN